MIGLFLGFTVMIMEATFLEAQAKYRSTWDTKIHRKINLVPYTEVSIESAGNQSL